MAAAIYAGMHYNEVKHTLENMVHGPYKLLYVSPERLHTDLFQQYLPALDISFIAVDEAHCVSQWGHDFRPDYLKIAMLRNVFKQAPIMALTASATKEVQQDIAAQLKLRQPAIFSQSLERKNIFYAITYTENKNRDTLERLREQTGTSLVYCRSRKQTEAVSRMLQTNGLKAVHYHAGVSKEKRKETQEQWMSGKASIMVATTAFGMGIDKGDVRTVLHYDAPEHLEAYYQESGRAGRDGKQANAILLYNRLDIKRLQESTALQYPPEAYLRQVYQSVVEYLQIPIGAEPHRYYDFDLADFSKKFRLEALPASHALKLLEQEGLWTISDAVFNPATVQFIVDRGELDRLGQTYPDLGFVATGLLRLYGTVFVYPTAINIIVVAKQLKLKKELVEQFLQKLHQMEVLEYIKPKEGPQMFFHHYRVDSRHLIIDLQRIERLRSRHKRRTDAMLGFLQDDKTCRTRSLLRYFDEPKEENCMHCDVCRDNKKLDLPAKDYNKQILDIVGQQQRIHMQNCIAAFPTAIREDIVTLIRHMVDEGKLKLHPDGSISPA